MPYINNKQIERLIEAEHYLWEHSDWKTNDETEKALWNIWQTVEEIEKAKYFENKKAKLYMQAKRKINPRYGRKEK